LKFHRESKTGTVYLLEKSGKPLRLNPSRTERDANPLESAFSGSIGYAGGQWTVGNASMTQFAKFAADYIFHAPVIDQTQLSGPFSYRQPVADPDANYGDNTDSFLRLIPELGLKLVKTTGSVELFVIDHAEKPSAN